MPTHIHLVLRQLKDGGISKFMSNILNSYSRYFNIKHNRKGPLWEGRFRKVLVGSDEQLLHLTRYVHLNPVTACLVDKPKIGLLRLIESI
jgi:putative transposase